MREGNRANNRTVIIPIRRSFANGGTRPMHAPIIVFPTGTNLGADRTVITRRTRGSAFAKEPITMHAGHLGMLHVHVEARQRDLLAEAEQMRLLDQASQVPNSRHRVYRAVTALRHRVGAALVRTGERVQGAGAAKAAPDALPSITTLRLAR